MRWGMNLKTSEDIHIGLNISIYTPPSPATYTPSLCHCTLKTITFAIIRLVRTAPPPLKLALLAVLSKMERL